MKAVEEHRVSGFCCHRVASDEKYQTPPEVYSGKNVMDRFYEHVVKAAEIIGEIVRQELDMSPMTPQQELDFQKPTHCRNCNTPLSPTSHKVRHHCHVSGRYLFPCCNKCNLADVERVIFNVLMYSFHHAIWPHARNRVQRMNLLHLSRIDMYPPSVGVICLSDSQLSKYCCKWT